MTTAVKPYELPSVPTPTENTRRWASIDKVDNGYIVTLEAQGKHYLKLKLVENRLKRALGAVAKFLEADADKEV